jgi:putative acetyltransferase
MNAAETRFRFRRIMVRCASFKQATMKKRARFPRAFDPARVGKYRGSCQAGGGFVWDAVLEYRVWCHPERGAPDKAHGNDYYYAFKSYPAALQFSEEFQGAEEPLALVLQKEYIAEPTPGQFAHVKKQRITEWPVMFLSRPRRTKNTIPHFLSPNAPKNRLDILRG